MNVKARLEYEAFTLELEGPESFVAAQLGAFSSRIPEVLPRPKAAGSSVSPPEQSDEDTPATKEKKRSRRSTGGPSCASRIIPLVDEGFFDAPKTSNEVGERLKEKATPYEAKHIAASLVDLTKRGVVRRVKQENTWRYVKP